MLIDRIKRIAIAAFLAFFVGYSLHLFIARNKAEKERAVTIEQRNKAAADAILSKRMADALLERIELMQSTHAENEKKLLMLFANTFSILLRKSNSML